MKGTPLQKVLIGTAAFLIIFLSVVSGIAYEIVLQDGRIINAVSYEEDGDQIRFRLEDNGKRYVIDKDVVVRIDGRSFVKDDGGPESDQSDESSGHDGTEGTKIVLSDGRVLDVDMCWVDDDDVRFKKVGADKTYRINRALVAEIIGDYGDDHGTRSASGDLQESKRDDDENGEAADALYQRRAYLVDRIKAYQAEVAAEKKDLRKLKKNMRDTKKIPILVIRKKVAWAKSALCFETPSGTECRKPSTPQQYKSYVLRGLLDDIRKQEERLTASQSLLAEYETALEALYTSDVRDR